MKYLFIITMLIGFSASAIAQEKPKNESAKPAAQTQNAELFTKQYSVPATFIHWLKNGKPNPPADPFAPKPGRQLKTGDFQEMLAEHGLVTNVPGFSIVHNAASRTLIVRGTKANHVKLAKLLAQFSDEGEKQILVIVEYIEVEHTDFSDWLLDNHLNGDATELRKEVQKWVKDERGTIIETSLVSARSGQRAKTESGDEYIYPTETSPPSVPNELTLGEDADLPLVGSYPSAFETRNLGVTLEVDPVLGSDNITIDLSLAPEIIKLNGHATWFSEDREPHDQVQMPIFHRMKVSTQVTVHSGRYSLLGSCRPLEAHDPKSKRKSPFVLVFVRGDVSNTAAWSVEDVADEAQP